MKLLKFGGTSLADAQKFLCVAKIIENNLKNEQIAAVLSAPAKVTNHLVNLIENAIKNKEIAESITFAEDIFIKLITDLFKMQVNFEYKSLKKTINEKFHHLKQIMKGIVLLGKCPESTQASVISCGEVLSVSIMKKILKAKNYKVSIINPVKSLVSIGNYLDSTVDILKSKDRISSLNINKKNIILMSGFIAGNEKEELVVLGRNGSDYSAAVLAACLEASCCEIWTDVNGVFTCDPREVQNAHLLKSISYQEAMELSYFGAKVLHPRTIEPISQFKIPCFIKNTDNIKSVGTLICQQNDSKEQILKGVTHLDHIAMFNISGSRIKNVGNIISRIFTTTSKDNIKIILITQSSSENKINFCISESLTNKTKFLLEREFQLELKEKLMNTFKIYKNLSILSVIGSQIQKKHNIASKICSVLGMNKINIFSIVQGASENLISLVIDQKNILTGVKHVHNALFLNKNIIDVILIGIGGVGNELINQIFSQKKILNKRDIVIKVVVIANSKKMLTSYEGIDLHNWKEKFLESKKLFNLEILCNLVQNNSFINPVIIDCTSDELLSKKYVYFINQGFHVITSNKKANTSEWTYYQQIRSASLKTNKKFLYETNVGAGLPVIQTLQNLFNTGDNLIHFKGILSGSLSFIFGRLEEGLLLSQATKEAKDLGFTEPNPCDDLSGIDVARKLLIIAREIGYQIELKDIQIEPLLPNEFKKYRNIDEFFIKLKKLDPIFLNRVKKAHKKNNVLRFVGIIKKRGKCSIKIEEIHPNDPLYTVKNGENVLAFYTNYYQPIPLVLRGYGAGKNVTASGVFSDLLRTIS
ncbi:bifunctional aspartate kinase/homoserine dehydrogenase I [Buchnera aphidicola (Muscaphis stroyani)]|uniref:Bifunctional aspartokinase/homoserine dehydrogenase n=1 Tax=Buchnera aphidicola (Muscaphis stroyani) TaxID=1241869 RepID=A0A4D6YIM5_9GAMM|nr:bifunctional aspartate kinase/homoserine dehydrogenase I [Buchnera aphidicola]QCI24285.1 bifunctional aspartate kinase/homoserine dehydrogenase I [Buchnera aphidicola (Muscaphis stroyani)]